MPPVHTLAAGLIPDNPVTRFAPSVTGWLHLGHVAHAVYVWGVARAVGAEIVVRLEDHDRSRYRSEYDSAILQDLEWLGLEPDNTVRPYRQSEHPDRYEAALEDLATRHRVYACDCTRATISKAAGTASQLRYSGRCRDRGLARQDGRGVRVVVEPGVERFTDIMLGEQTEDAASSGDHLLADRSGSWTYHFAVVVDDDAHGVNLVIRGEDLLFATAQQIRLSRMLGRSVAPQYLHHPLVSDDAGKKLSKRDGALGLRELRAGGKTPEEVLGMAANRVDLIGSPAPLAASELANLFTLS